MSSSGQGDRVVPDAAVVRVAQALGARYHGWEDASSWHEATAYQRSFLIDDARAAIAAALPFLSEIVEVRADEVRVGDEVWEDYGFMAVRRVLIDVPDQPSAGLIHFGKYTSEVCQPDISIQGVQFVLVRRPAASEEQKGGPFDRLAAVADFHLERTAAGATVTAWPVGTDDEVERTRCTPEAAALGALLAIPAAPESKETPDGM